VNECLQAIANFLSISEFPDEIIDVIPLANGNPLFAQELTFFFIYFFFFILFASLLVLHFTYFAILPSLEWFPLGQKWSGALE